VSGSLEVKVSKERLLATLEANRAAHGTTYAKAKAGYIKVTIKELEEHLTRLADGHLLERVYIPGPPEDHTGDYDDAIEMMKWSTEDTVLLTQGQFKQYVQDDWGWKDAWMASNTSYLQEG
jgi:hypothetical protein